LWMGVGAARRNVLSLTLTGAFAYYPHVQFIVILGSPYRKA